MLYRGGSRLVGRGVLVSRSHISFYLRNGGGGGGDTCTVLLTKQNANLVNPGVGLRTRFDANLFFTSRLKAKTKTTTLDVCEALYADDAAFCGLS